MNAKEALRCPECGCVTPPGLVRGRIEGLCPGCLASFAIDESGEVKVDSLVPHERAGDSHRRAPPIPSEAARADPSARLGKFILVAKLGTGSTGEVWKAWDTILGRWAALKVFHVEDAEELARFRREAETAAILSHPNIASIYEIGHDKGRHFLAMQYVDGVTLQNFSRRDRSLLIRLIRDAARAVGVAHRAGIVHRDLKPANLGVARVSKEAGGHDYRVYVLDFGLARRSEAADRVTASGIVVGTPAYMPPEQARGESADCRADVYQLGATLYELLTGRTPFRGSNIYEVLMKVEKQPPRAPRKLVPGISRDLERVILKCLEKEPHARYRTAEELAEDLDRYLDGCPVLARPTGPLLSLARTVIRRKAATAVVLVTAGLITGAAIVIGRAQGQPDPAELLNRGISFRKSGDLDGAIREFGEAIRLRQDFVEAHFQRGLIQAEKGRPIEAIYDFTRVMELDPKNAQAPFHRGLAHSASRLSRQAERDFTAALTLDPEFPDAYYRRGLERFPLQLWDGAAEDLRVALEKAPPDWPLRTDAKWHLREAGANKPFNEAWGLRHALKLREAIEKFKEAVAKWPGTGRACDSAINASGTYAVLGEKEEALTWFEKAVEIGYRDVAGIERSSDFESLRGEGRYQKALAKLKAMK